MKLYYSISEVADLLGVSQSLLRYWETEFSEIKPTKNARGVRMYKQEDIDLLRRIQHLTKERGLTLEGAREQLHTPDNADNMQVIETLKNLRSFLVDIKSQL
ncbi:MAG: MerR family transcriptional regulator [Bacteroidales bacterium]|nr:MerR family transcriptional regulator [Bacteroidales bacterium]